MTDAGEAFGQDMQQPAPDELMGMQGHKFKKPCFMTGFVLQVLSLLLAYPS
jgi:hypothetical protein